MAASEFDLKSVASRDRVAFAATKPGPSSISPGGNYRMTDPARLDPDAGGAAQPIAGDAAVSEVVTVTGNLIHRIARGDR